MGSSFSLTEEPLCQEGDNTFSSGIAAEAKKAAHSCTVWGCLQPFDQGYVVLDEVVPTARMKSSAQFNVGKKVKSSIKQTWPKKEGTLCISGGDGKFVCVTS